MFPTRAKKIGENIPRSNLVVLTQQEAVLLLYSQAIQDNLWLMPLVAEGKSVTQAQVDALPEEERSLFNNLAKTIVTQAASEWKGKHDFPVTDLGEGRVRCSLCNQHNRYIFYITNRFNGKDLNVGSSCIKPYFGSLMQQYGNEKITLEQLLKQATENRLKQDLERKLPGIIREISMWRYPDYSIVIPAYLTTPFYRLGDMAKRLLNDYLAGVFPLVVTVSELEKIKKLRAEQIRGFARYVSAHADKKFIATQSAARWLSRLPDPHWFEELQNTGMITWGIACRLREGSFMRQLVPDINKLLAPINMRVIKPDPDRSGYVYRPREGSEIELLLDHYGFLLNYGGPIFSQEDDSVITPFAVIQSSRFSNDRSLVMVMATMKQLLASSSLQLEEFSVEANEAVFFDRNTGDYVVSNDLQKIAIVSLQVALGIEELKIADVRRLILTPAVKKITREQLEERRKFAAFMRETPDRPKTRETQDKPE